MQNQNTGLSNWMKRIRRKNYLINPDFQLRVLAFFVGLAVVTILVFYRAVQILFNNLIQQAQELNFPPEHIFFHVIAEQKHTMNLIYLITSVFIFLVIIIGGMILSHHVAGPLFRMQKHIQKLSQGGSLEPLLPRKKDFFHELFADYNHLIDYLRGSKK